MAPTPITSHQSCVGLPITATSCWRGLSPRHQTPPRPSTTSQQPLLQHVEGNVNYVDDLSLFLAFICNSVIFTFGKTVDKHVDAQSRSTLRLHSQTQSMLLRVFLFHSWGFLQHRRPLCYKPVVHFALARLG